MNTMKLVCHNGEFIEMNDIKFENEEFSAVVTIKTGWYSASAIFNSSLDRVVEFSDDLEKILLENKGDTNFINETGNFDLEIEINRSTGNSLISGVLIKNMMDESRIEFSLEADYQSLKEFWERIDSLLNDMGK